MSSLSRASGTLALMSPHPVELTTSENGLTSREETILRAAMAGATNAAIAEELGVTVQTVKFHLTNIFRKLGVKNRTEAVMWAIKAGVEADPIAPRRPQRSANPRRPGRPVLDRSP